MNGIEWPFLVIQIPFSFHRSPLYKSQSLQQQNPTFQNLGLIFKAVSYGLRFFLLRFFTLGPLLGRIHRFKIRKSLESRSKIQIN